MQDSGRKLDHTYKNIIWDVYPQFFFADEYRLCKIRTLTVNPASDNQSAVTSAI